MVYTIHAFILCFMVVLMIYYVGRYAEVTETSKGTIVDLTYIRIYIIGIVVSSATVMLVMSPILSIFAGVQPLVIGEIVLLALITVFFGLQVIVDLERKGEEIETARDNCEVHKHMNKTYVRKCGWVMHTAIAITIATPVSLLFVEGIDGKVTFYICLIIYILMLFGMYFSTKRVLNKIYSDEEEIREQLEKNKSQDIVEKPNAE